MEEKTIALHCLKCGGPVVAQKNQSLGKCADCDALLPLPDAFKTMNSDEAGLTSMINRYNKAIEYSNEYQFHRAYNVYDKILKNNPDDFYASWGKVLAQYGVIYRLNEKLENHLICLRTHLTRIFDNENYIKACELADGYAEAIIKREALEIERSCQESIKKLLHTDPFDVFLLVDNSEENSNREKDHEYALRLKQELETENIRVKYHDQLFDSNRLFELEPILFSYIELSPIFIVISSDAKQAETPLIKNTWLRFITKAEEEKRQFSFCYDSLISSKKDEKLTWYDIQQEDAIKKIKENAKTLLSSINIKEEFAQEDQKLLDLLNNHEIEKAKIFARERTSLDESDYFAWWISFLTKQEFESPEKLNGLAFEITEDFYFQRAYLYAPLWVKRYLYGYVIQCRKNIDSKGKVLTSEEEFLKEVEVYQLKHVKKYTSQLIQTFLLLAIMLLISFSTLSIKNLFSLLAIFIGFGLSFYCFFKIFIKVNHLGSKPKKIDGKEASEKYYSKLKETLTPAQIADYIPHKVFDHLKLIARIGMVVIMVFTLGFFVRESIYAIRNSSLQYYYLFNEVVITGGNSEDVKIPAKIGSREVKKIGRKAFYNDSKIKSVKIEEGVEEISSYAFANCENLGMITLPKTIIKIGKDAPFANCNSTVYINSLELDIPLSKLFGVGYEEDIRPF